ncbi:NAD(P)-dependent alcohol dehydrogenase [Desulfuromonas carbonis]|uniref:NAD(P)-dependent alcohol dehydrogenase n=1 Tax=Desulfuromonas sp. DDH964 TaxID=1823759 RepID=UPI00078B515E|nr:NAD(P)-dependent alcohol dehydrogenase [Desulfuromonas sp. DDH964]AMV70526.1 mannitol dehydrogenase [Desulfuromonas sp. DDH964]
MSNAKAYSAASATAKLTSTTIPRRAPTPRDVQIEILYCGVCHSDLHTVRDEWHSVMQTTYPCVPGHEIVGRVTGVGSAVTSHKVGDLVGVGCLVDSDHDCPSCQADVEQFCPGATFTYNSPDKHGTAPVTYGGYSERIVVDEHFVLKVPANLDLAGVAPLLCAGITTWSPMRRWGNLKGKKVGVVGLGGLGHMGVKFARAFGAQVAVFTTSPGKKADALRLGAAEVILSTDPAQMKKHAGSFDYILDTIAADHDINAYLQMLGLDGELTLVGAPEKPLPVHSFALLFGRKRLSGSLIGGIKETQEMLDFCGAHNITADVEVIPIGQINQAYERLLKSDVKYRFSIDMASLKAG